MTIGIGGWGSRRKPMSLVRAIARSDVKDLTVVSYGGPDLGLLCATGKVRKAVYAFCSLDSIALEPHFRTARQTGAVVARSRWTRACSCSASRPRRGGCRSCRPGSGSARTCVERQAEIRTVVSPYADGEELVAAPALHARCRADPHAPRRSRRERPVPQRRPLLRRPVLHGRGSALHERRADRRRPTSSRRAARCSR